MSGVNITSNGDYLSLWNTDSGNSILILNEDTIVLTEGVTVNVDYNGDGVSEDLVLDNLPTGGFSLADDGTLALLVSFNDLNDNRVGNALVTLDISEFIETEPTVLLGDVNLDEVVNFLDIAPFISALSMSSNQPEADINGSGTVNFLDISPFIGILTSSGS